MFIMVYSNPMFVD